LVAARRDNLRYLTQTLAEILQVVVLPIASITVLVVLQQRLHEKQPQTPLVAQLQRLHEAQLQLQAGKLAIEIAG
jgi:4-hydroxy-3-methylbut-2-en-1-yl diphosphate synthase IspG/GcpE